MDRVWGGAIGRATDARVRADAQSGGVVTALLTYLLKTQQIDGAIVNVWDASLCRPTAKFVDTVDGIRDAAGSYYCQTDVVQKVLQNQDKRLAVVALGCQTEALELLIRCGMVKRERVFILGLLCGGNYSGNYIDALMGRAGINKAFRFRFKFKKGTYAGWPGDVMVDDGEHRIMLPARDRTAIKGAFEAFRCYLCFDRMNCLCDIAFGDPWGIVNEENKNGNTIFLFRSERGRTIMREAVADGCIVAQQLSENTIMTGQKLSLVSARYRLATMIAERASWEMPPVVGRRYELPSNVRASSPALARQMRFARDIARMVDSRECKKRQNQVCKALYRRQWFQLRVALFRRILTKGIRLCGVKRK